MIGRNYSSSVNEGNISESDFCQLATGKGFVVHKASRQDDIYKHIDFYLSRDGMTLTFDVKAPKRNSRYSKGSQADEAVWIEFRNVRGYAGWIDGEQEYIAFGFLDCFVIVKRIDLKAMVESKLLSSKVVYSVSQADYRLYQRKGRQDLVTRIRKSDLFTINHRVWYLTENNSGVQ